MDKTFSLLLLSFFLCTYMVDSFDQFLSDRKTKHIELHVLMNMYVRMHGVWGWTP